MLRYHYKGTFLPLKSAFGSKQITITVMRQKIVIIHDFLQEASKSGTLLPKIKYVFWKDMNQSLQPRIKKSAGNVI